MPTERLRDPGWYVQDFLEDPVLVVCPDCGELAYSLPPSPDQDDGPGRLHGRLVCHSCGLSRYGWGSHGPSPDRRSSLSKMRPGRFGSVDLFLREPCAGEVLWAFNQPHLDAIEEYVEASLRERARPGDSQHMTERLPGWIKAAKNRDAVLAAIAKMRERLADAG